MEIECIAGFAVISSDSDSSAKLYRDYLGLPLQLRGDYLSMDRFSGARHFGIWPLAMAAESCFGQSEWPRHTSVPSVTIEFELRDIAAVEAAVKEMQDQGQEFVHEARLEPWGQTLARFMSPEGVLIGLSFAPWLHENTDRQQQTTQF